MVELQSTHRQIRLVPFLMILVAALLILKVAGGRSVLDGLSLNGANASLLFSKKAPKNINKITLENVPISTDALSHSKVGAPESTTPVYAKSDNAKPDSAVQESAPRFDAGDKHSATTQSRLLEHLKERSLKLDLREAALDTREILLRATEVELNRKVEEFGTREKALGALEIRLKAENAQDIQAIVKAYERMKPRDAARVFEILDDELLVSVAMGMRTQALAGVLAEMAPEKAKLLTSLLAHRQSVGADRNESDHDI